MNKHQARFVLPIIIYSAFALYLYQPYFENFTTAQYLLPVNLLFAAVGCFVLSRRWVSSLAGSFFAGAIYGFGPFMLALAKFHPSAGLLAGSVPWLFCPAAYLGRSVKYYWRWLSVPLSALPFAAIVLFFCMSGHYRFFAVPLQSRLHPADLFGLVMPLVMVSRTLVPVGFYHVAVAPLLLGFALLLSARRAGIIIIISLATGLAFCPGFFHVSPIMWFSITAVCCSVVISFGMQALITTGYTDRKLALLTMIFAGMLAVVTLFLAVRYFQTFLGLGAGYARLFAGAAKMYVLGAVAAGVIFFMARAKLRAPALRWAVICLAMVIDIFLSARFIVDRIF